MTPAHIRSGSRRHAPVLLAVVVTAMVAVHLGLAGYAVTHWGWTAAAIGGVAAMLAGKLLLIMGFRSARNWRRRHTTQVGPTIVGDIP